MRFRDLPCADRGGGGRQRALRDRDRARAQPPGRARPLGPRSGPTGSRRTRARTRARLPATARDALLRAATWHDPTRRRSMRSSSLLRRRRGSFAWKRTGASSSSTRSSRRRSTRPLLPRGSAKRIAPPPASRATGGAGTASRARGAGPDAGVVQELQAAARHARMRGSPDSAAELTRLALRLLPANDPAGWSCRSSWPSNSISRAISRLRRRYSRSCARRSHLVTCAPSAPELVEIEYWGSGESAATVLAEEALANARDPILKARCHTVVAGYAGTVDLPKAAASAREALALLEGVPDADPGLLAAALSVRVRADLFLGNGFDQQTALRALALEERAARRRQSTRASSSSSASGFATSTISTARVRSSGTRSSRRARRATSRRSPTSC